MVFTQAILYWLPKVPFKPWNPDSPSPVLLFYQGKFIASAMRDEHITKEEMLVTLLENGVASFSEVHAVILRTEKRMDIIRKAEAKDRLKVKGA
ncbi:YetF domain-containing protein [Pontibacter harenae]|uniref:YetF domain-containing protein n=1 Tax=Pontibacter harenae TaxID=2894083 RepID=UPI0034E24F1F